MTEGNYITIGVFLIGIGISALVAYYGFVRKIEERVTIVESRCTSHQAVIDSIASLNSRIDKIQADNETFWKILGPHLAGIIHSPHNRERDELVDRFVHEGLSDEAELVRLVDLLHEAIYSGRWTGDKKLAGALLLARSKSQLEVYTRGG